MNNTERVMSDGVTGSQAIERALELMREAIAKDGGFYMLSITPPPPESEGEAPASVGLVSFGFVDEVDESAVLLRVMSDRLSALTQGASGRPVQ